MPEIGEIRNGAELGYRCHCKWIWHACMDCGKERWVALDKDGPRRLRCHPCAMKVSCWKGGRIGTKRGYILVWLRPSDFFYSMVDKSGYVLEHRLVVAHRLGRCLQPWEIVHHKDRIKSHNDDSNLQLVSDDRHRQITLLERRISRLEIKIEEQARQIRLMKWQAKNERIFRH